MRRLSLFIMALVLVAGFAFGSADSETPKEIRLLYGGGELYDSAFERFAVDFPDVTIKTYQIDFNDGSAVTMKTLLAAEEAPHVYVDYIGRVSEFLRADYALALNDYVRDLDKYLPGVLGPYTREGDVLGIPLPGGAQGIAVNMDIMAEIGFEPKWDWTIVDFAEMCAKVRYTYGGEKYGTGMFAANQSGDYLINNWFAAFGAEFYAPGDYSKTTIAETGGAVVYEFFQDAVRLGYIPPGAATLTDDDYVIQWATEEIAATAFFPSWIPYYIDTVIDQGLLDEPFDYEFFPFPRGPGVDRVPTYVSSGAIVVRDAGDESNVWSARLAEYMASAEIQTAMSASKSIPNRGDARMLAVDDDMLETGRIVRENGIMDVGLTTPFFAKTRPQHYPVLQKVLNLTITPDEAIAEYAARLDAALSE